MTQKTFFQRMKHSKSQFLAFLVILALLVPTGCGAKEPEETNNDTTDNNTAVVDPPPVEEDDGEVHMPEINPDDLPDDSTQGGNTQDSSTTTKGDVYTFGQPLQETPAVDDTWFENTVFLGDSRTEGLQLYSGITTGTFFWEWGMSVFKIDSEKHRKVEVNGQKMTLMEALSSGTWDQVYIMIGINDLGYQASSYQEALEEMVDQVKAIQSDAVIYLQTMPPVNEALAKENNIAYYINNENVKAFNDAIVQVAQEKQVVLLDTASCLTDSQGQLPADMSSDGVHFKKAGYQTWLDYLKCHTISAEDYQAACEAAA